MTKRYRTRSAIVADLFAHPAYEELPRGTEFVLAKDYDALATELMLWKKGCYQPPVPSAREWVDLREAQKTAKEALDREHKTLERVRELEDKLRHSEVERSGLTEQVNRLCLSEQSLIRANEAFNQRILDLLGKNDYLQKQVMDMIEGGSSRGQSRIAFLEEQILLSKQAYDGLERDKQALKTRLTKIRDLT